MSQYLMSVQSNYVPQLKKDSGNVVLDRVQLTEECARNVQWVFRMVMTCLIDRIYRGYYTVV